MPRQKKDCASMSIRIDISIYNRLNVFCEQSGQSKTTAIERALEQYIDVYDANMRALEALKEKG